jgi:peptidoglycan/LPS O-acetylase OafA/YrhL
MFVIGFVVLAMFLVSIMQLEAFSLTDFLVWLAAGGSAVAVSWISERIPKFQTLTPDARKIIQYVASMLLAIGAFAVNKYVPEAYLLAAAPYFGIAAGLFGVFFLNQAAHVLDPAKYRKKE